MKALSYLVSFAIAICGLSSIDRPPSATAADITGTWESVAGSNSLVRLTGIEPLREVAL